MLFEIEGYGDEIARIQGIPVATVWTRLHHARKEFFRVGGRPRRRGFAVTKPTLAAPGRRTAPRTSLEAEGVALLRSRARHRPTPTQKVRVRAALEADSQVDATWRGRPAALALVFVAVLLVGGAISSTSFARQWVGAQVRRLVAWVAPQAAPAPQAARAPERPPRP